MRISLARKAVRSAPSTGRGHRLALAGARPLEQLVGVGHLGADHTPFRRLHPQQEVRVAGLAASGDVTMPPSHSVPFGCGTSSDMRLVSAHGRCSSDGGQASVSCACPPGERTSGRMAGPRHRGDIARQAQPRLRSETLRIGLGSVTGRPRSAHSASLPRPDRNAPIASRRASASAWPSAIIVSMKPLSKER